MKRHESYFGIARCRATESESKTESEKVILHNSVRSRTRSWSRTIICVDSDSDPESQTRRCLYSLVSMYVYCIALLKEILFDARFHTHHHQEWMCVIATHKQEFLDHPYLRWNPGIVNNDDYAPYVKGLHNFQNDFLTLNTVRRSNFKRWGGLVGRSFSSLRAEREARSEGLS